ncbi:MAG: PilW family protein [Minisyncoccia bacterium]
MFINKIKNRIKNYKKGFTLIELLIATGIFVMVIITLSQVYISIIRSERVAYALLTAENNIRNKLELMARSIRMGKNFDFDKDYKICFDYYLEKKWRKVCYQYNNFNIEQFIEGLADNFEPLFDPNLKITKAHFYQRGDQINSQLTVVVSLEIETEIRNQIFTFHLETAITPRIVVKES